ncbi:MAG: serine/threonine protein kinase, partial [Anaerolineae bacterium]|nr:serine/threonine protein kinase [Anaerolineae bacterium]
MVDPLIGEQLGDYVIQRLLGRGGMARVYVGYDERLQRHAAVKVIHSDLLTVSDRTEYAERFRREARAIARLSHPNIVGVYQFGEYEDGYYMAMVFIEGKDLRHLLHDYDVAGERMPLLEVLNIVRGIGSALDYAHSRGVIHRDVKPANIIVSVDNVPILTDFGLALSAAEGSLGDTFGSAHYIAPEQAISSARAVPQSDQYSLGVCLYEMLAGRVPFDDPSAMSVALKHLNEPPPPLRERVPDLSPAVEAVVMKALAKDPAERYATVTDMAHALAAAIFDSQSDMAMGHHGLAPHDLASVYDDETWPDDNVTPRSAPTPGRRLPTAAESALATPEAAPRRFGARRMATLGAILMLFALAVAALLVLRQQSGVAQVQDQTPTAAALAASQTGDGVSGSETAEAPTATASGAPTLAAAVPATATTQTTATATATAPTATDQGVPGPSPSATPVRIVRATTAATRPVAAPTLPPTVTPSL